MSAKWIPVVERLPDIDYSAPTYKWYKNVIGAWDGGVAEVKYAANGYAKTEKGKAPRFEWNGRICPFEITHWMPLPDRPDIDLHFKSSNLIDQLQELCAKHGCLPGANRLWWLDNKIEQNERDAARWRAFRARDEYDSLDFTNFRDKFREDADAVIDTFIAARK